LLPLVLLAVPRDGASRLAVSDARQGRRRQGADMTLRAAAKTRQFWLLIGVYALCGLDDFFVTTHIVAFAQDRGVDALFAGQLLALMGLAGFVGVICLGAWSDRSGPMWPALASFLLRIATFALVLVDQSPLSIAVFALVFGFTFLMTAPLLVIFVRDAFGTANLGAISGLIVMIHHMCGGLGAWIGAAVFDARGGYDVAFAVMALIGPGCRADRKPCPQMTAATGPNRSACAGTRAACRRQSMAPVQTGRPGSCRTRCSHGSCRRARNCRRGLPGSRDRRCRARFARSQQGRSSQRHRRRAPKSTRVHIAS
jgi:hypothetical protein